MQKLNNLDENAAQKTENRAKSLLLLTAAQNVIDDGSVQYMSHGRQLIDFVNRFQDKDKDIELSDVEFDIASNPCLCQQMILCVNTFLQKVEQCAGIAPDLSAYLSGKVLDWQYVIWDAEIESDDFHS